MEEGKILKNLNVSRETLFRLKDFIELLKEWNKKINLVSSKSMTQVWSRHIDDSAQLWHYLPKNSKKWVDIGSGAGFPGLIVALVAKEKKPDLNVTLIDANQKKCAFLEAASRVLGISVEIIPKRIEHLPQQNADILSARALTSATGLVSYLEKHGKKNCRGLFLKGKNIKIEIKEISNLNNYQIEFFPSVLAGDGFVLQIEKRRGQID